MINKRWALIGGALVIVLGTLAIVEALTVRGRDNQLAHLREQRDHICISIQSQLYVIVEGKGDSRLQDLHASASWRFGDEAINRACVGTPMPVRLGDAEMCYALGTAGEKCFLEPLRKLHELYKQQPWRSR